MIWQLLRIFVLGVFEDEDVLLKAVTTVREAGIKIHEVFTPYPVHTLEEVLGYRRTRLPIAAFLFGPDRDHSCPYHANRNDRV